MELRTQDSRNNNFSKVLGVISILFEAGPRGLCCSGVCPDGVYVNQLRALLHGVGGGSCAQSRSNLTRSGIMRGAVG